MGDVIQASFGDYADQSNLLNSIYQLIDDHCEEHNEPHFFIAGLVLSKMAGRIYNDLPRDQAEEIIDFLLFQLDQNETDTETS